MLARKHWSLDDWNALSEQAQEFEIAALEYQLEAKRSYLDLIESKLPRTDGVIQAGESIILIWLARMELL